MAIAFFEALRSLFLTSNSDSFDTERKKLLAGVSRDINRSRHRKWYLQRKKELTDEAGAFFYELYRLVNRAGVSMQNAAESEQLRTLAVEFYMEETLLALKDRLSPQAIEQRAETLTNEELSIHVERDIIQFNAGFDMAFIEDVDRYYNLLIEFSQFVVFEFADLLQCFDPTMSERDTAFRPKLRRIDAGRVIEIIKDFLEISYPLEENQDWATVLSIAAHYKENLGITLEDWKTILIQLSTIQSTSILVLIVRHVEQDPNWKTIPRIPREHIADAYRATLIDTAKASLQAIIRAREQEKLTRLLSAVFGQAELGNRLRYYTAEDHDILLKNGMEGYRYVNELNYLKIFILDFYKKDIRELFDMFILRGQWGKTNMNRQFTDSFHEVLADFEELLGFDGSLSLEGTLGAKLRATLAKNKSQAPIILSTINDTAQKLIVTLTQSLAGVEILLKALYDDHESHTLIRNWDALETAGVPLGQRLGAVYQKLGDFVEALRLCQRLG
jgi:hypothetical protein